MSMDLNGLANFSLRLGMVRQIKTKTDLLGSYEKLKIYLKLKSTSEKCIHHKVHNISIRVFENDIFIIIVRKSTSPILTKVPQITKHNAN